MTLTAFSRYAAGVIAVVAFTACDDRAAPAPMDASVDGVAGANVDSSRLRHGEQIPFEHSWDLKLPGPVHTSWTGEAVPDLIFFQLDSDDHEIYAVDAMSGRTRWVSEPLPKPINLQPHVHRVVLPGQKADEFVNDDRLYVVSDDILFCFDIAYGQLVWRYHLPFSAASGAQAVGVEPNLRVFVGDWSGRVRVLSYIQEKAFPHVLWQWNLYSEVTASPVAREGLVYVGDHAGSMHCFELDREKVWSFKAGTGIHGQGVVRGRALYFGTTDNVFYALNRLSGEELGSLYLSAPIKRQPMTFSDEPNRVYVWTDHRDPRLGGLHAIATQADNIVLQDAQDRTKPSIEVERLTTAWFYPGVTRLVSSTPEHLYVTTTNSSLVQAVNRSTGKLDWAWKLDEGRGKRIGGDIVHVSQYQDPNDLNRSIYTVDGDGQVVAYRLFGYLPKDRVAAMSGKPAAPAAVAPPKAEAE
ncbi:MAG TPA: PQQ-binding-like beta-propeller repeat protein [Planctomycetota bacterium]|nr:PQQ-binding-like beta-propeller repeat protein [Planctomycetota bacterium]